jgi:hypothetical protein
MAHDRIYFAWVNDGETFNPAIHNREDEDVFSFDFEHSEGDFAALTVVIKNPRIGLLNTGRKVWAILSYGNDSGITPIFRGRLVGVPTNIFDTLVTLSFTARPSDFVAQKTTLAESLKVLPYYDSIFVSPDSWGDPDVVLEAYSRLWHIDPVTLVVTASDILVGEDGVEEVTEDEHFYDDMQVTLNSTPLRAVTMTMTIPWTQSDAGGLDLTGIFRRLTNGYLLSSFTLPGLISSWPKSGDGFGSGWDVTGGQLVDLSGEQGTMKLPDIFYWNGSVPILPEGSVVFPLKATGEYHSGETAGFNFQFEIVAAPIGYGVPSLSVSYTAGREFAQIVTFTLRSDQQSIVTLPGDDESLALTLNANKVSDPTEDGSIPLGDVRLRNYTHTERGLLSIQYGLLVARAHLIAKSRAVETSFKMGFRDALRLNNLRKNGLLHDHRLPGGQANGKIIGAKLSVNGDDGEATGTITIASSVGYGGSYTASPGTPTIWDEGYIDDYQQYENQIVVTDTEDIAWTIPVPSQFDDGVDFARGLNVGNAVMAASIINDSDTQRGLILAASAGPLTDQAAISSVLSNAPTQFSFKMIPMEGGPFQDEVVVSVSDLVIPQQINLEAPSNA